MPTNVQVPGLGESVSEAVLIKWHRADGEFVNADDPVCELETDKANVDVPAPAAGVITRVAREGAKVRIGETIATVEPSAKPAGTRAAAAAPAAPMMAVLPTHTDELSPAVRRITSENKIDPASVSGTGKSGRVTKEDVVRHMDRAVEKPEPVKAEQKSPASSPAPAIEKTTAVASADGPTRRVPMTKIRRKIAERLVESQHTAALLTTFNEVDLLKVNELRVKYKEQFEKAHGVGLGYMSFFARACCRALMEFDRVNARIDGDDIVYHDYVHLGIAVSTDRGLAVPVLRNAHAMNFAKIEQEVKRVATATRDGKLGVNELSGGTFTITNGGVFGSLLATPIVNPPQSAILGMHAIKKRPVVVDDQIVIRPMMYVALTYDHRIIDGKESVSFLVRVKELLEDPTRLMFDI